MALSQCIIMFAESRGEVREPIRFVIDLNDYQMLAHFVGSCADYDGIDFGSVAVSGFEFGCSCGDEVVVNVVAD